MLILCCVNNTWYETAGWSWVFFQNINLHFFHFPFFFSIISTYEKHGEVAFSSSNHFITSSSKDSFEGCGLSNRRWIWQYLHSMYCLILRFSFHHEKTLQEYCLLLSLGPILYFPWIGLFYCLLIDRLLICFLFVILRRFTCRMKTEIHWFLGRKSVFPTEGLTLLLLSLGNV